MPDLWEAFLTNDQRVTHKWKHYFPIYEDHFRRFQNTDVVLIEIGCCGGGSLQLWKRFLGPHARIVGLDIDPACAALTEDQIDIRIGDQSDADFLRQVVAEFGAPDIVIDDGSHMMSHIRASFDCLYELVSRNGVYLVESLHTAYWEEHEGGLRRKDSFIEHCKDFIDELNADWSRGALPPTNFTRSTLSMHFYDSVVVFEKGRHTTKRGLRIGRDARFGAPANRKLALLEPCAGRFGDLRISEAVPRVVEIEKAVYLPQNGREDRPDWGLYESDGRLIEEAAYKRGPGRGLVGQSNHIDPPRDPDVVHEEMIYGGMAQAHYGHFLLGMLPRYWIDFAAYRDRKILLHALVDLDVLFTLDFLRESLGALGLDRSRFVTFDRPTVIDRLIVPEPSFQEMSCGHPLHARLCESISDRLDIRATRSEKAVYLSKENTTRGVWGVANEKAISSALAAKGVDIVFPERLPFRRQIALFEEYEAICGLMGSALHTTLFARTSNRIIGLGYNTFAMSNHLIIDRLKDNRGTYVFPRNGMIAFGAVENFSSWFECPHPEQVAEELYALI